MSGQSSTSRVTVDGPHDSNDPLASSGSTPGSIQGPEHATIFQIGFLDATENLHAFNEVIESRLIDEPEFDLLSSIHGLAEIRDELDGATISQINLSPPNVAQISRELVTAERQALMTSNGSTHANHPGTRALEQIKKALGAVCVFSTFNCDANTLSTLFAGSEYNTWDAHIRSAVAYFAGKSGANITKKYNKAFLTKAIACTIFVIRSREWALITPQDRANPEERRRHFTAFAGQDRYLLAWARWDLRQYIPWSIICGRNHQNQTKHEVQRTILVFMKHTLVEAMNIVYTTLLNQEHPPAEQHVPFVDTKVWTSMLHQIRAMRNKGGLQTAATALDVNQIFVVSVPGSTRKNDPFKGSERFGESYSALPGPPLRAVGV